MNLHFLTSVLTQCYVIYFIAQTFPAAATGSSSTPASTSPGHALWSTSSLASGTKGVSRPSLCFPFPGPRIGHFQGDLVPFFGVWHLGAKLWVRVCSLPLGTSLLPGTLSHTASGNRCILTHGYTHSYKLSISTY